MRTCLLLAPLLLLAAAPQGAPKEKDPLLLEARIYDVTELLYHGFEEPQQRSRIFPDFAEETRDRWQFAYPGPYHDSETAPDGEDVDRIHELIEQCAWAGETLEDAVQVGFTISGTRTLARVVTLPRAHERVEFMLGCIRRYVTAHVRLAVYEGDSLLGTTSGGIGQSMCVSRVSEPAFMWDYERVRGPNDHRNHDHMDSGWEVAAWAVKLPHGKLRVHGSLTQRELKKLRPLQTAGGGVELPEFTAFYQPFVADIADPGVIDVPGPDGRKLQLRLSCGTEFPDVERPLEGGGKLVLRNLFALLRSHHELRDPFSKWYMSFNFGSRWAGSGYGWDVAGHVEDAAWNIEMPSGIGREFYGYAPVFTWRPDELKPEERGAAEHGWRDLMQTLDQYQASGPARFRVRTWRVAEGLSEAADLGPAQTDCELAAFEDAVACRQDLYVRACISEYEVGIGPGVRDSWHHFSATGEFVSVNWSRGVVEARYARQEPAGLEQFDTGLREPGPLVIDHPAVTNVTLKWFTKLQPGEQSRAVTPAGEGHVLVGILERLQ